MAISGTSDARLSVDDVERGLRQDQRAARGPRGG
jgi:hypothetical protein